MPVTGLLVLCAIIIVTAKAALRYGAILSFKPCAGHEKCDGNDAANKSIREITEQSIPSFGKLSADEKSCGPARTANAMRPMIRIIAMRVVSTAPMPNPKSQLKLRFASHPHPEFTQRTWNRRNQTGDANERASPSLSFPPPITRQNIQVE